MKTIGKLIWYKKRIHSVRPVTLDDSYNILDGVYVYFNVPFIMDRQVESTTLITKRLESAILNRLKEGNMPVGNMDLYIETPPNSEYQIAEVTMSVVGVKALRRWEFEYKLQEAYDV